MISLKNGNQGEGGEKYQELLVSTRGTRTSTLRGAKVRADRCGKRNRIYVPLR
jgi:hypothetical protein